MKVYLEENKLHVKCEYSPEFNTRAKQMQGRWNGSAWVFGSEDEDVVRSCLRDIYGEDGTPCDTLDVIVDVGLMPADGDSVRIGSGYLVCRRPYRDSAVKMGENAVLLHGSFDSSGGSAKSPRVSAGDGVEVKCKRVPVSLYERVKGAPWIIRTENECAAGCELPQTQTGEVREAYAKAYNAGAASARKQLISDIDDEIRKVTQAIDVESERGDDDAVRYLQGIRYGLGKAKLMINEGT